MQQPGKAQIPIPIVQLYAALKDVELLDREHPIFSPNRRVGRHKDSYLDRQIKTYAAAVMALFMQENKSKSEAGLIVERTLSKAGYSLPGVDITGSKVSYWRDMLTGHHGGDPLAQVYEQLVSAYSADPRLTAANALDELASFVNHWNLENPPY